MVPYYLRNMVQNKSKTPKNVQSRGKFNIFLSFVTTPVMSRYSCKISSECFKLLNVLSNITKIDPKTMHKVSLYFSRVKPVTQKEFTII